MEPPSLAEVGHLLQMLLGDASRDAFDEALTSAQSGEGREPAHDAEADARRTVDLLVEMRDTLDRYKRRALELRGLFETAGDLSSLRDVETVLQAIVRRGRQLLGTDVAYLMLIDEERGDTYMRVTEGTITPGFIGIRLPLGVGLGGLVAENLSPHWTSDYLADQRYLHVIDGVVRDEHIVAILGVPLKVGPRLIGVLFAADRATRAFTQDEISLLSSLADHAAIVIENASLFQETLSAVSALSAAKADIEQNNRRLRRTVEMHERLMALVLDGGTIEQLANAVVDVMGGSLLVVDTDATELARAGSTPAGNQAFESEGSQEDIAATVHEVLTSRRSLQPTLQGVPCLAVPVVAGDDSYGALISVCDAGHEGEAHALERAATIVALLLLNRRARDEADNRFRGELLAELLMAPVNDPTAIQRRALLLEVNLDQPLTVLVAVPRTDVVSPVLRSEATALARSKHGLVATHSDRIVMLIPGETPDELASAVARRLHSSASTEVTVGAAGPLRDLTEVKGMEAKAHRCARVLLTLGRGGTGASADSLGIYGLLLSEVGHQQIQALVTTTLGPVQQYDADRGTLLLDTVRAYFDEEGRVAAAADRLFVHTNTLYQRLARVDKLLGPDWRTGDRALEIRLALRLLTLAEQG
jgi:GAF domain-containing protein